MKSHRLQYIFAAGISLLTFAVYLPALRNGFVNWDDNLYVYDNPSIRSLDWSLFRWAFTTFHASNWHPLTWLSHAVDYAFWGLNPLGHHLSNIVLHGLNTFLVALLASKLLTIRRMRPAPADAAAFPDERETLIAAGVAGLLFGVHPLHVESVAWISERKDLLCGLFFLLSIAAYLRSADAAGEGGGGPRYLRKDLLPSLGFFVLALMSKPMAVSLPAVLLLLDWRPLRRIGSLGSLREAVIEKAPFIAASLASAAVTMAAQADALWSTAPPLFVRVLVAAKALAAYLYVMLLPARLMPVYPYEKDVAHYLSLSYGASALLVIAVSWFAVRGMRAGRAWPAAWWYYVVTLLPVLGLVQVGNQAMADRYTYLPSIGPFLIIGTIVSKWWTNAVSTGRGAFSARIALRGGVLIALAVFSVLTMKQTAVWKSSHALWTSVIGRDPNRIPTAYYNRGLAYEEAGNLDEALSDFSRAISLRPDDADAYFHRGSVFRSLGRRGEALADFNDAVIRRPTFYAAYVNRGRLLRDNGWIEEAGKDFETAVALGPYHPLAHFERGELFRLVGDAGAAAGEYRQACELGSEDGCSALRSIGGRGGGR